MRPSVFALVLEPDAESASTLGTILLSRNVELTTAANGEDGWRALAARRPDVVLLSLSTPGLEIFFRRLRDEYMGKHPRLIGIAGPEDLAPPVARLDLDAVLLAPVAPGLLLSVMGGGTSRARCSRRSGRFGSG